MTEPTLQALIISTGWVLVHFTWQALLIGLLHSWLLRRHRNDSPARRYRISLLALVTLMLLPVLTAVALSDMSSTSNATAAGSLPAVATDATGAEPVTPPLETRLMPWLVAAWILGVIGYATRLGLGYLGLRRILREATEAPIPEWLRDDLAHLCRMLGIRRRVRLLASHMVDSPLVTGWLLPTILLPVSATTRLSPDQLRMTLMHELAHIHRHDHVINLLQVVIETLFFFHPVVHQVSRSLRREREQCCDDLVTAHCANRLAYARLLADLESLRLAPHASLALGIAASLDEGELTERVRRIVGARANHRTPSVDWRVAVPVALAIALLAIRQALPPTAGAPQPVRLELPPLAGNSIPAPIRLDAGERSTLPTSATRRPAAASEITVAEEVVTPEPSRKVVTDPATTSRESNRKPDAMIPDDAGPGPERLTPGRETSTPVASPENAAQGASDEPVAATPIAGEPVLAGGQRLNVVAPDYPRYARRHAVEGKVTVEFVVTRDGRVEDARVVASNPGEVFDSAALEAVRQWTFEPFTLDGNPVSRELSQTLEFTLKNTGANGGISRDCEVRTGSRICRNAPENGSNVVSLTGRSSGVGE